VIESETGFLDEIRFLVRSMFDFLSEAQRLRDAGAPFVLAIVVRTDKPTSAKPGAKAIITADGKLHGWVGGSCASPTVIREALKALEDGQPRLVHLSPQEMLRSIPQEGLVEVPLTCASGGTLEIYVEPCLPRPHLLAVGHLPIVAALVELGVDLGFEVTVIGQGATADDFPRAGRVLSLDFEELQAHITPRACVVVASHGNYDEPALEAALKREPPAAYVALVASPRRAAAVKDYLRESGLSEAQLARLKCPAGLDIGAVTPEEIALSILAEIVQLRRTGVLAHPKPYPALTGAPKPTEASATAPAFVGERALRPGETICPTCGMIVEIATAIHTSDYGGQTYVFCCPQCKRRFEKDPEKMLAKMQTR